MVKETRQGGRPVDLRNRVEMTATSKHPSIKEGVHFKVHQEQTGKLIAQGWAIEGHVKLTPAGEPDETGAAPAAKAGKK